MANDQRKQPIYLGHFGDPEAFAISGAHPYPGQVGSKMTIQQPGPAGSGAGQAEDYRSKTYQLVQGDSSMSTAPFHGATMWWSDKSRYKVSSSPTATARGNIAGVVQVKTGYSAPGAGDFFFIQTEGPATVKHVDAPSGGAFAVGDSVIPSATAGKADRVAAGTAPTYPTLGLCSRITNGNAEIIVDLAVPNTP
jgi:hypothetical protein